ncbi:MAG: ribosome silencing factor [Bacteroidia bacterium]|nr:ribosome silencing factor [Bacteroidia bacterium]
MVRKDILDAHVQSEVVIKGLQEKKGQEIVRMDLKGLESAITDYFVICTATSDKHAQALADSVREFMKDKTKSRPVSVEGYLRGEWILLDFVDVIVHIFLQDKREFYRIEALWGDAGFEKIADK